ncbi:MAG TPA: PAS domain S-box protein [Chthoniobacterales bacterium]|jgi:two-component system cell cycle sensor histidine kinase/response regulator CckA|nr:PAS domain S-box protein [Chthoniobacterales bacterium]
MDKKSVRVLMLEDNPADAELMLLELRRSGFKPECERVDTEAEFHAKLDPKIDIILSDYAMPQFSGLRALELLRQRGLGIPFIIVSGTIGEDIAVKAMQDGAADYILKDRLARLGPAVERALEETEVRDERKRAEEQLGRLTREHELILNCAGDGICGIDAEGNIIFVNPTGAKLLGWNAAELLGRAGHAMLHAKQRDAAPNHEQACPILQTARDGITRKITNDSFWRKDGTQFPVKYVSAPLKDENGNIGGTIVVFDDVSAEVAAEARIKLQAEQYRLLFDTNPNPMWVFDTQTMRILAVNQAAIVQYGYSREEFLKLNVKDLRPAEDVPDLIKARSLSSPMRMSHFSGQFRHVKKNGARMMVEVYSSPLVWDGAAARIVSAIDVTDRKRAEERLREQADMINLAQDAIIIRDFKDGRITFWNKGAERVYGWSVEEAIGQSIDVLLHDAGEDREPALRHFNVTGEFHGELKQRRKDGRDVIVNVRATLIRNADGSPRAVLAINTDVTEKKKLETQLLRAQRLESIGTLASGVAHDLNNILTPILMCSELLQRKLTPANKKSTIKLIQESAQRGSGIVKQVLTFARGVEGERVLIKPSHLIDEMGDIARKTFPKSIGISARYSEDLWSIEGDPTQLHQVLLNLSVNARDAMPNGGTLSFGAENIDVDPNYAAMTPEAKPGPHVVLRVSDTGTGMPRKVIDKIFDPFFTTKEIGKGTGLGLSTVLGIVKSHGGFISVYSEPDKGTTFKVFLPAKLSEEPARTGAAASETLRGDGELILMIDDEAPILTVTRMILEDRGYRIVCASEGPEALAIFAQQMDSIQAVLTDIALPYMDGVSVIRALKKMKPETVFIASTGQGEHSRDSELRALGVASMLTKPYDTQKLLETLKDALARTK